MMRYSRRPQKKSQPVQNNFAGCRCGWAQIAIRRAFAAIYAMQAPPVLVFIYQMPSQAHRDIFEKLDIPKKRAPGSSLSHYHIRRSIPFESLPASQGCATKAPT